ncbi:hypothetical protein M569_13317, partial [Genlisea aurea]
AAAVMQVEELTSGASGRIIPVFRNLRQSIASREAFRRSFTFVYSFFVWILLLLPRLHRMPSAASSSPAPMKRRKFAIRRDEEDTTRRRALAQAIAMVADCDSECRWSTSLFYGVRRHALFYRSWFPDSGTLKGILIIIHGLNEHSGRYSEFAKRLVSCNFGVYAVDWIGHGGSDGLHGYVPSLDHVVADTVS